MSPEEKIEAAQKLIDEARAEIAAKKRNWPEKIEPGMMFRWESGYTKGHTYIFARGGCLVNIATGETFEGDQGFRGKQDQFTYLGHARDLIKIADDTHEPTGAELVGKVCEFSDDGERWKKGVCARYELGRDSGSYQGNFDGGYEWFISARRYREDQR